MITQMFYHVKLTLAFVNHDIAIRYIAWYYIEIAIQRKMHYGQAGTRANRSAIGSRD